MKNFQIKKRTTYFWKSSCTEFGACRSVDAAVGAHGVLLALVVQLTVGVLVGSAIRSLDWEKLMFQNDNFPGKLAVPNKVVRKNLTEHIPQKAMKVFYQTWKKLRFQKTSFQTYFDNRLFNSIFLSILIAKR